MLLRAALIWLAMAFLAIANGALREKLLIPRTSAQTGHVLSTLILSGAIFLLTWLTLAWIGAETRFAAMKLGAGWMLATIAFEFLAGHYLFGNPWNKIAADYNLAKGRIWLLVPISLLTAPIVVATIPHS